MAGVRHFQSVLAAVALMLGTVVLFRMKQDRYAWVTVIPTAWLLLCTITAGMLKLVSSDPAVSFVAHARKFSEAAARGEMQRIIFNDWVDAGLCVLFLAVVLSLMGFTIKTIIEARRSDRPTVHEFHPQMEPAE